MSRGPTSFGLLSIKRRVSPSIPLFPAPRKFAVNQFLAYPSAIALKSNSPSTASTSCLDAPSEIPSIFPIG